MIDDVTEAANGLLRKGILAAADSKHVNGLMSKHGMRLGARRFVAGETLEECITVLRGLNARGLRVNTTVLGEGVLDEADANRATSEYSDLIERLAVEEIDGNVSLKLTHLGLAIDEELALNNVNRLVALAGELGFFLRIDMEESRWVDATLEIYRRLVEIGHNNVGTALQSYLKRTEADLEALLPVAPNLRIVKGAYLEPPELAFAEKSDVDAHYIALVERMLEAGSFVAVATHDAEIIEHVIGVAERLGIEPAGRFEFQMLYGVRAGLQSRLLARGFPVLVGAPYGPEWYGYLMRRLAERPANLGFLLKNLVRG